MALVLTQEGGQRLLQWLLSAAKPNVPTVHLFGTNYAPHEAATLSQFAANEVAGVAGYAPILLSPGAGVWTITEIAAGGNALSIVLSWTFTAAVTVYGYYVSDDTFGVSLWGEQFAASFPYPTGGVFALQLAAFLVNVPGVS